MNSPRQDLSGFTILLAEDNPINQEVALEMLGAAGLIVDLAPDGARAVEMAKAAHYDLILMDVQMPVLDGLQATREIRRMAHHANTPIVAMTANAFEEDRQACLSAGMNDHVAKPVDVSFLFERLRHWLPLSEPDMESQHDDPPTPPTDTTPHPGAPALPSNRFDGIDGLDVKHTLLYLPSREDIIERVLIQYCRTYADGLTDVHEHIHHGRYAEAQRAIHALRGASGAVGAVALASQAQTLDELLQRAAAGTAPTAALGLLATDVDRALLRLTADVQRRLAT